MNFTQRSAILIFCCAGSGLLMTAERRGWWGHHGTLGVVLPLAIPAGGIGFWAAGLSRGRRT